MIKLIMKRNILIKMLSFMLLVALISCTEESYPTIEDERGKAYSIDNGLGESIKKNTKDNADWIDKKEGTYYEKEEFLDPKTK